MKSLAHFAIVADRGFGALEHRLQLRRPDPFGEDAANHGPDSGNGPA